MKALAYLLIVVNVGLFGLAVYQYWLGGDALGEPPGTPPDVAVAAPLPLLDEVDVSRLAKRAPGTLQGLGSVSREACFAVGPLVEVYAEGASMRRVREWLEGRRGRVEPKDGDAHELVYGWIHLPPVGARDMAYARVEELAQNSFRGATVVPNGNMKNAVSIGVYGIRTALERDLARLKAKGFEPRVLTVQRTERSPWFIARFPAGYEFPGKRFRVAFPGLDVVDAKCPS